MFPIRLAAAKAENLNEFSVTEILSSSSNEMNFRFFIVVEIEISLDIAADSASGNVSGTCSGHT